MPFFNSAASVWRGAFARRLIVPIFAVTAMLATALALRPEWIPGGVTLSQRLRGRATVADRVIQFGPTVESRLSADFRRAKVLYPPTRLTLVALKAEKRLELWAADSDSNLKWRWIRDYPILRASGHLGPKLREGDLQVPEGIYRVESLNPNSSYHLALRVDYPNVFDRAQAARDGRTQLGGDIMIHGGAASIGCLAMGDAAAEDLFVLTADAGINNTRLLFCPFDLRRRKLPALPNTPWMTPVYQQLRAELQNLPRSSSLSM